MQWLESINTVRALLRMSWHSKHVPCSSTSTDITDQELFLTDTQASLDSSGGF